MPLFVTIGYGDRAGYDRTDPAVLDEAHGVDAKLKASGALVGTAGAPVQVRNPAGVAVQVSEGSFMTSRLPVAGFAIIEAESLVDAIDQVSRAPCAVAHGVVEVWPLGE